MDNHKTPSYVLITPARNEAEFIESTIRSVISQTIRPVKWVIVSDGSTDGTDEIVKKYEHEHPWMELVRLPDRRDRNFAGKVYAFNMGYERVKSLEYHYIGNLDADVSFEEDYFLYLLGKLSEDPALGLVGTAYTNVSGSDYDFRFADTIHVAGLCQLFRRECFEQIGGYKPIKGGGIDFLATLSARAKGWKTRSFTEKKSIHYRESGTAQMGVLRARFRWGARDYAVGNHPVWEVLRSAYHMTKRPVFIGGLAILSGYTWPLIQRKERAIPRDLIVFHRHEQMQRLRRFLAMGWLTSGKAC